VRAEEKSVPVVVADDDATRAREGEREESAVMVCVIAEDNANSIS